MSAYIKNNATGKILHSCSGQTATKDTPILEEFLVSRGLLVSEHTLGDATEAEIDSMIASALAPSEVATIEIQKLESTVTPRRIREMTTVAGAKWVDDVEKLIAIERSKL